MLNEQVALQCKNTRTYLRIVGYDKNKDDIVSFLRTYSKMCSDETKFINYTISTPTFDEVDLIMNLLYNKDINLVTTNFASLKYVVDTIFKMYKADLRDKLLSKLFLKFQKINSLPNMSSTSFKNVFVRVLKALDSDFNKVLELLNSGNSVNILFIGKVNKYDLLILDILYSLGINIVLVDFQYKQDVLITPLYTLYDGVCKELSDIENICTNTPDSIIENTSWVKLNKKDTLVNCLNMIYQNNIKRINEKIKVVNIGFSGVLDKNDYLLQLNSFYLEHSYELLLIDNNYSMPTYDELTEYKLNYVDKGLDIVLKEFNCFKYTSIPVCMEAALKRVLYRKVYKSETQKANDEMVLSIWVLRICKLFFAKELEVQKVPIIILWNKLSDKISQLIQILAELPIDIIHFCPNKLNELGNTQIAYYDLGISNMEILEFPKTLKSVTKVETVAYKAQEEIRDVLAHDIGIFRMKQFKSLNSIVLKTTYEEMNILWGQQAKFRPSFSIKGDVVVLPNIFAKVEGVEDDINDYLHFIKEKKGSNNTVFISQFPFVSTVNVNDYKYGFIKQIVYNGAVDLKRYMQSEFYAYSLYSDETQQFIMNRLQNFLSLEWCSTFSSKQIFVVLYVLLNMPDVILQLIHTFDFSGEIPKLVLFNSTKNPLSFEESVLLMFLNSIGFDIVVYVPTGYKILEQYIDSKYFNTLSIGKYNFNLTVDDVDRVSMIQKPKKGFFSSLFS